ncbi:dihydrofolate reductase family protein [Salipaludibacillus agaradhaerens]|uniref:dihydrofolate reductase family protein n=1 Tax=Salipaludibacillus agaradhaerens TaxID=76935 RepID=UPI000997DBE8|nr:dihydrofolate reductase family protein [Salipaludibacillus agaradhaerens]
MRNVILSMAVSLDGYIESTNRDISWHVWDADMQEYMSDFLETVDTLLYGRTVYELMINHWPAAENAGGNTAEDRAFAQKMNKLNKIVFSRTLNKVTWNARLVKEKAVEELLRLKREPGKDMVLFGGANIAETFMRNGVIDEYRLIVNPVVLGSGNRLFKTEIRGLTHVKTKGFNCGNVLLIYHR